MKKIYIYLPFLFLAVLSRAQNNRYYVDLQAAGANNGQSWADAFTDLQTALQLAQAGDEVWVAAGTYRPTSGTDRAVSFEPQNGVQLYGGFAGTENSPGERDWAAHPAVLTGDIGTPGDSTDNSYNVVYLHQPDSSTVLDGFTLRDGQADAFSGGAFDRSKCGAGLYIMGKDWEAYPTIQNCVFERNTAKNYGGGAMVNGTGAGSVAPQFIGCRFENNRALNSGGGLAWIGASWVERNNDLDSCLFVSNNAGLYGGGIYFIDAERLDKLDISDCEFMQNTAIKIGGGLHISVGRENGGRVSIQKSNIKNNTAGNGSAVYITSNGFLYCKNVTVDSCSFLNNLSGGSGTAIVLYPLSTDNYSLRFAHCLVKNNSNGRMMSVEGGSNNTNSSCFLDKNVFSENNTFSVAHIASFNSVILNNIEIYSNTISYGSLISTVQNTIQKFFGCNFYRNTEVANINFINARDIVSSFFYSCNFIDNSITNNHWPINLNFLYLHNTIISNVSNLDYFLNSTNQTLIAHSYFDTLSCAALPANVTCGPGILTGIDPLFVNPDSGDYRLQPCSPLINAGSNAYLDPADSTDLAGRPRVRGGTVDIGAYESQGPALAAAPAAAPSCPGGSSGSIVAQVQDACLPLQIGWQSAAGGAGSGLQGLPAGDYQLTLTDAKNQALTFSITVPLGDSLHLLTSSAPVLCGDTSGGSAAATLDGGSGPYSWLWAGGSTDSARLQLPAGAYLVTVTDANGCSAAGVVQVDKTGNLDIDIELGEISCPGATDGFFTVLPLDGKAPFTWHWQNGDNTPTLGMLGPGDYLGTLSDALGCTIGWILPLDEPAPLSANAQVGPASDSISATGSISLQPQGGTAPYTAHWNTGDDGLMLDSLTAGVYGVTLTDARGCTLAETVTVGVTSAAQEADAGRADFALYPNPAREAVWIAWSRPVAEGASLQLMNSAGVIVREAPLPAGAGRLQLVTGDLPRGLYVVQAAGVVRKLVLE